MQLKDTDTEYVSGRLRACTLRKPKPINNHICRLSKAIGSHFVAQCNLCLTLATLLLIFIGQQTEQQSFRRACGNVAHFRF